MTSNPSTHSPTSDAMQRFTATGRPFAPPTKSDKRDNAMSGFTAVESWGSAPANLLPVRYTDDSLISVPVLRPQDIGRPAASITADKEKKKKSLFSSRRKSENSNFVMRQIPRGEYLKSYAKDESGKYCGTEEPADDCILRGQDLERWRGKEKLAYSPEVGSAISESIKDGVIR